MEIVIWKKKLAAEADTQPPFLEGRGQVNFLELANYKLGVAMIPWPRICTYIQ